MNPPKKIIENTLIKLCASYLNDDSTVIDLNETDWPSIIFLAKKHRIIKAISELIERKALEIPALHVREIHSLNKKASSKMLVFTAEIAFISKKLKEASIPSIPLKGPIAAKQIYNDFTAKNSRDIDFLILPNKINNAIVLLEKNGYTCTYPYQSLNSKQQRIFQRQDNQLIFVHAQKQITLDIHWKLFANSCLLPISFDALLKDGSDIKLGKEIIPCLSKEHLLFFLCAHGAKHQWSRLYWLMELAALIKNEKYNWKNTLKSAISIGIERPLVQGMILIHQLFEVPISNEIIDYAKTDSQIQTLIEISKSTILSGIIPEVEKRSVKNNLRTLLYKMRLRKELSYKLNYWKTISINDFELIELPQSLFFLYFWLRPVFWLWRYILKPIKKQ